MIPRPIPKTKSSNRIIKVSRTVVNALKNQMEIQDAWKQKVGPKLYKDQGLVFASVTGGYLNPSNLNNRHFKPILRAAGLSAKIRLYDLRHTHATLLFRRCRDIKLVSERLGHKDVAITLRTYYHLLPRSEEEAVGMFDDVLTGKVLEEQDPEPPTEELFEDVCVKACVTDNVIAFPTGGLLKKKTRNCLRE
jgi:integrase